MAEHIKILLGSYIKESKKKQNQFQKIKKALNKTIGKELTSNVDTETGKTNELIFFINSSSLAYQLSLKKNKIIEEIKKDIPQIKKINIKIR